MKLIEKVGVVTIDSNVPSQDRYQWYLLNVEEEEQDIFTAALQQQEKQLQLQQKNHHPSQKSPEQFSGLRPTSAHQPLDEPKTPITPFSPFLSKSQFLKQNVFHVEPKSDKTKSRVAFFGVFVLLFPFPLCSPVAPLLTTFVK